MPMPSQAWRRTSSFVCALLMVGSPLLASCTSPGETDARGGATQAAGQTPAAAPQAPFTPADACALLTKAEVESVTGKKVLDPLKEESDQLVTCSFGDPDVPQVAGRALSQVLELSVMTGREGAYYKGAVAQVHDGFKQFRENAGEVQTVSGLGEDAYWDGTFRTLFVVTGKYLLDLKVDTGRNDLAVAKAAASKALARLPH
jgi:hypothetical protein